MSSPKTLKFLANTETNESLYYDDAPVELRELEDLCDYLFKKYPMILNNYWNVCDKNQIRVGQLEDLMNYLCDNYNGVLQSYLIECKPIIWLVNLCKNQPEEAFNLFNKLEIGLIPCDELEDLVHMCLKEKQLDTTKHEVRILLENTLKKPLPDYNSSIMKIGDKEYYMGHTLNEKGKQEYKLMKAKNYVKDNALALFQQHETRIQQLEAKLNSAHI